MVNLSLGVGRVKFRSETDVWLGCNLREELSCEQEMKVGFARARIELPIFHFTSFLKAVNTPVVSWAISDLESHVSDLRSVI